MKSSSVSITKSTKSYSHANTMRPPTAKSYVKKSILENEKSKESFGGGVRSTSKSQKVKKTKKKTIKKQQSEVVPYTSKEINTIHNSTQTPIENTTYTDFSDNIINEKRTKDSLRRLLSTSNDLLTQQNAILSQCDELAKTITTNDYEIDKMKVKQEAENFPQIVNTYSANLENILEKLRKHTSDIENSKKLKEENNSLRYKLEMLSIDKSDDYLNIESQLHSVRNVYANEMNSMINFFSELGIDNNPIQKITGSNFSEDKVINFFSLIKTHMKNMKMTMLKQEEQIKFLSNENMKIQNEMNCYKQQSDAFIRKKNLDYNESVNFNSKDSNFVPSSSY